MVEMFLMCFKISALSTFFGLYVKFLTKVVTHVLNKGNLMSVDPTSDGREFIVRIISNVEDEVSVYDSFSPQKAS